MCFYVGKGHARRAYDMRRGRNRYHKFIQEKLKRLGLEVEVRIIAEGLTESEAFELECGRIAFWKADGVELCNLSDGGEGPSGRKQSQEERAMRSAAMKARGYVPTPEHRQKIADFHKGKQWGLGSKRPAEAIEKTRQAHLGRVCSPESRAKMSAAKKGHKYGLGLKRSPETCRKIGISKSKENLSEETLTKMRKPKSEAHKNSLSATTSEFFRKKKAGELGPDYKQNKYNAKRSEERAARRAEKNIEQMHHNLELDK